MTKSTARRIGLWALIGLAGVGLVVVLLRVGAGMYLRSPAGRAVVAQKLSDSIGLPVEVSSVELGSTTSEVKFRVLDPAGGSTPLEILSVESASADVTLTDILTGGANPKEVNLRGVSLALRLDSQGKILTTLPSQAKEAKPPGTLPSIKLDNGRIAVRQDGRPEFTLAGVNLKAEQSGPKVVLNGTIDDPGWGKWKLSGEIDRGTNAGWLDLATDDGPLVTERLRSIPMVPLSIWEHVQPNGRGAASVRLSIGPNNAVSYDVRIQPKGTPLTMPDADVTLGNVTGLIRVHDEVLELGDCKGTVAGGTIAVSGTTDFRPEPTVGKFTITADGLDVNQVPPEWGLTKEFGGKLRGKATVELKAPANGPVDLNGSAGGGELVDAKVLGFPAEVRVRMHPENGKLRLRQEQTGKTGVAEQPLSSSRVVSTTNSERHWLGLGFVAPDGATDGSQEWSEALRAQPLVSGDNGLVALEGRRNVGCVPVPPPFQGYDVFSLGVQGFPALRSGHPWLHSVAPSGATEFTTPARLLAALLACGATVEFQQPADPKRTDQTVLDATVKLRDIDVGQLLDKLDVKVPYKIAGKVTVEVAVAVPLGQAATRAAYKFSGTVSSPELVLEGLTLRGLSATVNYQNGILKLTVLKGTIPPAANDPDPAGTFSGTATVAVEPPGDAAANLLLDRIPLGEVLKAIPGFAIDARGRVSGKAEFKAPFNTIFDPATWAGTAGLSSDSLTVAGRTAKAVRLGLTVAKGTATLTDAAATVEGIPVTATASLGLTGKYPFDAALKTSGTDVTDLRKLVPEAKLPLPVEGVLETESKVNGTLVPFTYTAGGTVKATKLTLGKTPANHVELKWELTAAHVAVSDLKADVFGGSIGGSADYPFDPKKAGAFNLTFKEVDLGAASAFVPDFPVKVTGSVTGKVAGTIPPADSKQGRVGNLDVDLTAPKLTVQGIPAERLVGKAVVKDGAIDYSLEGKTLGGSFEVKGRYPGQGKKPDRKDDRGSLRVSDIDLSLLARTLKMASLAPLRGRVDVTFEYDNDLSTGSGRIVVRGLAWGEARVGQELRGVLLLHNGTLELRDFAGSLAGGDLRARARVQVNNPARNFVILAIDRADAKRLLAPIPELNGVIDGDLSIVVRGSLGPEMHGSGTVSIPRGTVSGVEVSEFRVPFTYAAVPGGYSRLAIQEASSHAGNGQLRGNVTMEWGQVGGARVDGRVTFTNLPLRTISPSLGESGLFGNGRITGRFDLSGTNVKSADDLNGALIATLNNTSVKEVPVLQRAVPYLNPAGLVQPFQAGDVRANLTRGVFRVERLALSNPGAQLFAEGTVTTRGTLDLNVVAHTGQVGPDVRGLRLLGLRLPAFGPIPLTLIRDVTDFFSNRTIRLTINGTVSSPVVRVNAAALLGEEAVRFFLTRYVVPAEFADLLGVAGVGSVVGGSSMGR